MNITINQDEDLEKLNHNLSIGACDNNNNNNNNNNININ